MKRRSFLQALGAAPVVAAVPAIAVERAAVPLSSIMVETAPAVVFTDMNALAIIAAVQEIQKNLRDIGLIPDGAPRA